nr:putative reverse transcriptase domain-containing protein [Tanacetum cinerariifolium]
MLVNIRSVQNANSIILVTALYVVDVTKWVTLPDTERPRPTCFKCGDPNHFRRNFPRMNRATTSGRNRPNRGLAITGNTNQGNNRNQARGQAFALDLSSLPPPHEVEIHLDLIPRAMPVAKSPYHLAPTKMQELSNQLKELKEKDCKTSHPVDSEIKEVRVGEKYDSIRIQTAQIHEKNYTTHDLELGAVAFALKTQRHYLYETKSVIYTDHKSLQHIFDKKELNMRQRRWIELFNDCDCEIRYHPAQSEGSKGVNTPSKMLKGLDKQFERKEDGGLYLAERIWVPVYANLRTLIMNEAHATRYFVHPGAEKMYYDLRGLYWWPGMRKDIAIYVKVAESKLIRPEIVQDSTDKIVQIKERLKATRDRKKSYADNRQKPLEFNVGDKVLLKVMPRKGV